MKISPVHVLALLASILVLTPQPSAAQVTAYKTGERVTGLTKQCYYTFGAKEYTKTVESHQLCPLSIRVSSMAPE